MNSEKEKTSFFGFGQLRFVIGMILFLAAYLKAYQLSTVPLPPPVQDSVFTPILEFLNNRYLLMVVVEGKILFALLPERRFFFCVIQNITPKHIHRFRKTVANGHSAIHLLP
ncbi:MAG: hypothetical protein LBC02_06595 [Planctomycetaceae bacterium]|jgi:hypothetical protein|nr:hypothetical protein [Planctomycetaceae bacterium]